MKTKPTRGKGGRKKFSVAKLASPDNTLDENINLLAIGECAANPHLREAFQLAALWEKFHSRPAHIARSHEEKLLRMLHGSLARIAPEVRTVFFSALTRLDPEPFRSIATAIEVVRRVNESGAFQTTLVRAALLAQERFGFTEPAKLPVTCAEWADAYKARYGGTVNEDFLCRECKQKLGFTFKPGTVGRKRNNPDNSPRLTS